MDSRLRSSMLLLIIRLVFATFTSTSFLLGLDTSIGNTDRLRPS